MLAQRESDPHMRDCVAVFTQDWQVVRRAQHQSSEPPHALAELPDQEFETDIPDLPPKPMPTRTATSSSLRVGSTNNPGSPMVVGNIDLDQGVLEKINDSTKAKNKQSRVSCVHRVLLTFVQACQ